MTKSRAYVCSDCKHVGNFKKMKKGSRKTEIFWWVFFSPVAILYSLYRLIGSKKVCEKCDSANIFPTRSDLLSNIAKKEDDFFVGDIGDLSNDSKSRDS